MKETEKGAQLFNELPSVLAKKIWSSTIKFIEDADLPHDSFCATLIWTGYFHSLRNTLDKYFLASKVLDQYVYTISVLYEIPLHDVERLAKLKQFQQAALDHLTESKVDLSSIEGVIKFLCISSSIIDGDASPNKDKLPSSERIATFLSLSLELSQFVETFIPKIIALVPLHNQPSVVSDHKVLPPEKNSNQRDSNDFFLYIIVIIAAIFISIFMLIVGMESQPSSTDLTENSTLSTRSTINTTATQPSSAPSLIALPTPANGQILRNPREQRVAPLTINTYGSQNYYFVLEPISGNSNRMAFFVRAGMSIDIDVPVGTYTLYYATGNTWYGTKALFGPDTIYQKCDDLFAFTEDANGYTGWTVSLQPVSNGNLDTDIIDESNFPK